MLIRIGYDITFEVADRVAMVAHLNVHPSRRQDLRERDQLLLDPPGRDRSLHRQLRERSVALRDTTREDTVAQLDVD